MAKEFDIYLSERLTECDIIVYSLPYRDGLSALNRMVLDSCIESYTLYKFVAVQTGSKLVSRIDSMLKTCYEMLNCAMPIDATADFKVYYSSNTECDGLEIIAGDTQFSESMFAEADDAIKNSRISAFSIYWKICRVRKFGCCSKRTTTGYPKTKHIDMCK